MSLSILLGLALSTFVSEDLASIAGGLLAREGHFPLLHAVIACGAGVYLGDLGLWWLGRIGGRRALALPWLRYRLDPGGLESLSNALDRHLALAILTSRFVPGARLPMYVAAGVWGRRPLGFAVWTLIAVMAWTPALVVSTAYFGDVVVTWLLRELEAGLLYTTTLTVAVVALSTLLRRATAQTARYYHHRFDQTIERPN